MSTKSPDLLEAYKKEKNSKFKIRLLAMYNFFENDREIPEIANMIACSENSVRMWIKRFDEAGIDGLRDLHKSGCIPKVPKKTLDRIINEFPINDVNPLKFRQRILDVAGIGYSMCQIRRIMHKYDLSKRKCQSVHINHATPASVYSWQSHLRNTRFPYLEEEGFTIVISDEAFFVQNKHNTSTWGSVGTRTISKYLGDHARVSVFGSIADNGKQMFLTFSKNFTSKEFIICLEALRQKYGKVAVLCDRWSVHKSNDVKDYLKEEPNVKLIFLPKGSPYLNVVEQCWHDGKRDLLGTAIYRKISEMRNIIDNYYLTTMFTHRDMFKYIYRSPTKALNYL